MAASPGSTATTTSSGRRNSNTRANQAASLAAVIEFANAHREIIPGLANLVGSDEYESSISVAGMTTIMPPPKTTTNDDHDDHDRAHGGGGSAVSLASSSSRRPPRIVLDDGADVDIDVDEGGGGGGGMMIGDDDNDLDDAARRISSPEPSDVAEMAIVGHPSLPSVDAVSSAAARLINDNPPFVSMSVRDSAPQLKLEDPNIVIVEGKGGRGIEIVCSGGGGGGGGGGGTTRDWPSFQRRLVVGGGMKGYRMSRATHGVSVGCYYYEALILGSATDEGGGCCPVVAGGRGAKRPLRDVETESQDGVSDSAAAVENEERTITLGGSIDVTKNGHVRIGWSTRNANLQAPVGYDEHSYAIRDILGSRLHKSRREDNWGGRGFGPGDVIGMAICLVDEKRRSTKTTTLDNNTASTSTDSSSGRIDASQGHEKGNNENVSPPTTIATNQIRFFKNGQPMGNDGVGFDGINPGIYYPAISCYGDGRAYMNFGPNFVYPPGVLSSDMDLRPISELCRPPPLPEEAVEGVIPSRSKEGKNTFFSKRTDDGILLAFKELIRVAVSANYRGVRWSGNSLCVSSEYEITLTCT
ncbi:hypothetical protein ACHAXA_001868 [Cyclostephanos tholiformis]|uniref:SPRY domain-containing protein n=1 Tax=Cyclostephanos tholiformis TaxID=382380 RepID=A0ABD3RDC5_9STRA